MRLLRLSLLKHKLCIVLTVLLTLISFATTASQAFAQARQGARTPRPFNATAPAEVTITFSEQLVNSFLDGIFTNLKAPSFPLARDVQSQPGNSPNRMVNALSSFDTTLTCASEVVLQREVDGARTAVHFSNGRIQALLAFTGAYSAGLLGCLNFRGHANTLVNLEYDRQRQVLVARAVVQELQLSDMSPRASNLVKGLVQNAIDKRANPIEILQASQLSSRVAVAAAGGSLRLRLIDMRPEILQNELRLHLFYEFTSGE
jgi:hypothetical protein